MSEYIRVVNDQYKVIRFCLVFICKRQRCNCESTKPDPSAPWLSLERAVLMKSNLHQNRTYTISKVNPTLVSHQTRTNLHLIVVKVFECRNDPRTSVFKGAYPLVGSPKVTGQV